MSTQASFAVALIISVGLSICASSSVPQQKVFTYLDEMPIKAESKLETTTEKDEVPVDSGKISEEEQKCWDTIDTLSKMIFQRQKAILDDLEQDLNKLNVTSDFKSMVKSTTDLLRSSMDFALDALEKGRADDYFDALFDTSESIITLSTMLKNPELDDDAFFVLVKAISRLGRNNSSLVQELTSACASRLLTRPKEFKLRPTIDIPTRP